MIIVSDQLHWSWYKKDEQTTIFIYVKYIYDVELNVSLSRPFCMWYTCMSVGAVSNQVNLLAFTRLQTFSRNKWGKDWLFFGLPLCF